MQLDTNNPLQPANLANALRCGAKTRLGTACQSPAVRGLQRCRMHGGTNKGAPHGNRHAWIHGDRSAMAIEQLKEVKSVDRDLKLMSKLQKGARLRTSELDRLLQLTDGKRDPAWLRMPSGAPYSVAPDARQRMEPK